MKLELATDDAHILKSICGVNNENIRVIEDLFKVELSLSGNTLYFDGDEELYNKLAKFFDLVCNVAMLDISIKPRDISYLNQVVLDNKEKEYLDFCKHKKPVCYTYANKPIYAKTLKQNEYVETLKTKDLTFSIGSAGTGKTYLAVCYGISELKKGNFEKVILTRPAVEAGESLGFLPGDLKEKVDPYLRPLYDALYDMLGFEATTLMIDRGQIEIAPLAYMRGRTLDKAFIILDEAQNATLDQLKMFLTRLGGNSKMTLTGDLSQIDLPNQKKSGLKLAINLLHDLREVGIVTFEKQDVIRHPLVAKIIKRFEKIENSEV